MASFTAGTTFVDGVANDVTAAKLGALVNNATPTSGLIQDRTAETVVATNDTFLIGDASDSNTLKRMTVANVMKAEHTGTINTTAGTITTLNSTTGTITTGVIPTLTSITKITSGTGTAAAPAISPTGDTNTGIFFPAADTIAFAEGGAEAMRIDSSANVGIGMSPTTKLEVLAATNTGIRVTNGTMSGVFFNTSDTSIGIGTTTNHPVALYSNNTERLRIEASGNVGIGTASPAANAQMTVVSQSATKTAALLSISATSSTAFPPLVIQKQDNNSTTSQVFVSFNINAGANGCGQINANGANAAAFGAQSDIRLKENITALPSQIDNVCALKPCEFDYRDGSGHQIGFIAQEIQEIYPDCVGDRGDGMLTVTGWSKTEARLVKAIQELKSENDSLRSRIEALEAK